MSWPLPNRPFLEHPAHSWAYGPTNSSELRWAIYLRREIHRQLRWTLANSGGNWTTKHLRHIIWCPKYMKFKKKQTIAHIIVNKGGWKNSPEIPEIYIFQNFRADLFSQTFKETKKCNETEQKLKRTRYFANFHENQWKHRILADPGFLRVHVHLGKGAGRACGAQCP